VGNDGSREMPIPSSWDRVECLFLGNDWKAQRAQQTKLRTPLRCRITPQEGTSPAQAPPGWKDCLSNIQLYPIQYIKSHSALARIMLSLDLIGFCSANYKRM